MLEMLPFVYSPLTVCPLDVPVSEGGVPGRPGPHHAAPPPADPGEEEEEAEEDDEGAQSVTAAAAAALRRRAGQEEGRLGGPHHALHGPADGQQPQAGGEEGLPADVQLGPRHPSAEERYGAASLFASSPTALTETLQDFS